MLATSIDLIQKYDYLEEKFKKGYEFLRKTDLKALPLGRADIDGDEVFASVQEYTTMPADTCKYESHNRYFGIQYVVEGQGLGIIPSLIASLCHIRLCRCICTYYRYGVDTG
ncbi:YhcH/YjgK/YiaL family protein [Enterocloster clostridioformis]|nr:YhcH/YjgK/YiaL family protein [Enterocloster clostridioformis]